MSHPGICHLNIGIHVSLKGLVIQIWHILEASERTVWRKFEYWRNNNIEGVVQYPSQPCIQFSKSTYMCGQPLRQLVSHIFMDTSMQKWMWPGNVAGYGQKIYKHLVLLIIIINHFPAAIFREKVTICDKSLESGHKSDRQDGSCLSVLTVTQKLTDLQTSSLNLIFKSP